MSAPKKKGSWKEGVAAIAESSGIPKKTVEEVSNATSSTLERLIKETRPDKIGEATQINTPFGAYKVGYLPSRTFSNPKTGEKIERPACFGITVGVPRNLLDSANTGIKLEKAAASDTAAAAKKKTA
jgi:nucleoid DNA-binding protein